MSEPLFQIHSDAASWSAAVADRLVEALDAAIAARRKAVFAGSGGSTPAPIYRRLAQADLDWSRMIVTLVDERFVDEDSPDSNARLLRETLLVGPAAAASLIGLRGSAGTPEAAAEAASRALAGAGARIDAALLGMGADGHILSMFPGNPALPDLLDPAAVPACLAVPAGANGAPPPQPRLSLNLAWLKTAGAVVLALAGEEKRRVFETEWRGDPQTSPVAALRAAGIPLEVFWTEHAR